ncbi:MAG: PilZ domain-containing protein [Pseudomonadales bacterium]|nr:PilZ domain-containing protein [Pseudomonadales bacterium]
MDKRTEPRIEHNIRFFVHVSECEADPDIVGTSVACEAIDFSTRGMQFKTEGSLYPGTRLNITIGIGEPFAMYLLQGEIRWIREIRGEQCMGVLLEPAEGTDLAKWEQDFLEIFG